jgi:multidrug efflux pump
MFFLPVTLIITLLASLVVAYIINPVFAVQFMKTHEEEDKVRSNKKGYKITAVIFAVIALLSYIMGNIGTGNFVLVMFGLYSLNRFVLWKWIKNFQEVRWPKVQDFYKGIMEWVLQKSRPVWMLVGTVVLFILTLGHYSNCFSKRSIFP